MARRYCEHCSKAFRKGQHYGAYFPYGGKFTKSGKQWMCIPCNDAGWTFTPGGKVINKWQEKAKAAEAKTGNALDALFVKE